MFLSSHSCYPWDPDRFLSHSISLWLTRVRCTLKGIPRGCLSDHTRRFGAVCQVVWAEVLSLQMGFGWPHERHSNETLGKTAKKKMLYCITLSLDISICIAPRKKTHLCLSPLFRSCCEFCLVVLIQSYFWPSAPELSDTTAAKESRFSLNWGLSECTQMATASSLSQECHCHHLSCVTAHRTSFFFLFPTSVAGLKSPKAMPEPQPGALWELFINPAMHDKL